VSQLANMLQLSIRRLTITSSLMQCPFPYKMGSIGYWASAYWKIFFICRPSEIKFTVILFPLQLIWIRWSLSIRSENATLTSQQPSGWASGEKKKRSFTQLYSATWETFGSTCQTENCCSHWLAQTTIHSSQYLCWLRFLIRQSDTLTVNTGVRTRNAACNESCRMLTAVRQRKICSLDSNLQFRFG